MSLHLNFEAKDLAAARAALTKHFFMLPLDLKTVGSTYTEPSGREVKVCTYVAHCPRLLRKDGMVARFLAYHTVRRVAGQMSADLGEDCIGVSFDGGKTGQLCGPRADKWGAFNPEFFTV